VSDDPYTYAGTSVLQNKLDIRDPVKLDKAERRLALDRIAEGVPTGDFDLAHLKAIHRHLFQDIYDWAGQIRTVEIAKGGTQFMFRQYIQTGIADVQRRIVKARYYKGSAVQDFATEAGVVIGDINHVHPFREGNGRTQLQYLKQLAERAGHRLDLTRLEPGTWLAASKSANQADYAPMAAAILKTLRR
jgi:cell filamentation protein